jgi:hypothetical protein
MSSRGLLIFVIFHLANAAMLPLVGQKLALQDENQGTALMSGCIVAAQIVMVPMAALVGHKADILGPKASLSCRIGHFVSARFSLPLFG